MISNTSSGGEDGGERDGFSVSWFCDAGTWIFGVESLRLREADG